MPLIEPPDGGGSLAGWPERRLAGRSLYRVWRYRAADGSVRDDPWWFASLPAPAGGGGRFDLPAPMGTCYLATTPVAAVLEALQAHLTNLPVEELRVRRLARLFASDDVPPAADLTSPAAVGRLGVTAALWAGSDRALTQRWALALRRDGWWAVHAGIQHDPSGTSRGVALFDTGGAHGPTIGRWRLKALDDLHTFTDLIDELARWGVAVRGPADLPFA